MVELFYSQESGWKIIEYRFKFWALNSIIVMAGVFQNCRTTGMPET